MGSTGLAAATCFFLTAEAAVLVVSANQAPTSDGSHPLRRRRQYAGQQRDPTNLIRMEWSTATSRTPRGHSKNCARLRYKDTAHSLVVLSTMRIHETTHTTHHTRTGTRTKTRRHARMQFLLPHLLCAPFLPRMHGSEQSWLPAVQPSPGADGQTKQSTCRPDPFDASTRPAVSGSVPSRC